MNNALELRQITRSYHQAGAEISVLRQLDLQVAAGELIALLGPSGCGKSTLLHVAGLLDRADSGTVLIGGEDTSKFSDRKRTKMRSQSIGFVYQSAYLLPEFTALENIMMPLLVGGVCVADAREKALNLAERLQIMDRISHRPSALSGGQQQRVAIARAFANDPAVILADEPTGNLDPQTAETVFALFRDYARIVGTAVLMVTHNHELAGHASRIVTLEDGRIKAV